MELQETFFHLGFYASHNNLEFPLTKGTSLFKFNYIHHLLSLDSDQFHYGTWRLLHTWRSGKPAVIGLLQSKQDKRSFWS